MRRWFVLVAVLLVGVSSFAELRLAAVFSDNMVLQRDQKVPVWGWDEPGAEITVEFAGQKKTAKVKADGSWMVRLKSMKASAEPGTLSVSSSIGNQQSKIGNVLVGEVWLCSGQSNMHMLVRNSDNADAEIASANYPLIRMFLMDLNASPELQWDCTGAWQVCSPETVPSFSATAYFYGRELHRKLDVPIGLIRSSWGGTCAEAWSPMESLKKFPAVMEYKAGLDKEGSGFDAAAEEARYAEAMAKWEKGMQAAKEEGREPTKREVRRPKESVDPKLSQNYPANLYNAMIHPLVPYGIRGAIWYQGERNTNGGAGQAFLYRDLLANMVTSWRKVWGDTFPFYAVQLPNFKTPQSQPSEDTGWAFIRESFMMVHKNLPNAGMAITIDVGEEKNIHPKNKQATGYRLAQQALAKTYGEKIVAGGPVYKSLKKDGSKIIISFEDTGSGLVAKDGGALKTFAMAGADKKFVWADAEIVDDTIVVSSAEVAEPVSVRYAWADNPVGCNLFNKEGFPASPFRTDDWAPCDAE